MNKLLLNLFRFIKILYPAFTRIMQYDEGVAGTDLRAASQQPRQFAWLAFNCETHQRHSIGSSSVYQPDISAGCVQVFFIPFLCIFWRLRHENKKM
jgi:hypothetical protein